MGPLPVCSVAAAAATTTPTTTTAASTVGTNTLSVCFGRAAGLVRLISVFDLAELNIGGGSAEKGSDLICIPSVSESRHRATLPEGT